MVHGDWAQEWGRGLELGCWAAQVSLRSAQSPGLELFGSLRPVSPPPPPSSQLPGASCPLRSASPRAALFVPLLPPPPWRLPVARAPPMSDSNSRTEKRKVKHLRIRDGWKARWSHPLHLLPDSRARAGLDTRPRPACCSAGGGDRSGSGTAAQAGPLGEGSCSQRPSVLNGSAARAGMRRVRWCRPSGRWRRSAPFGVRPRAEAALRCELCARSGRCTRRAVRAGLGCAGWMRRICGTAGD